MNNISPPRFALRFLRWFCPSELYEGIEGDLIEQFEEDLKPSDRSKRSDGYMLRRARRRFVLNALNFFRPSIILRNKITFRLIQNFMIGNYFKVAARNIAKRKMFSFINAFGLSIGISFCILIYLFIKDEKSFDQFHANKGQIYRMEAKSYDTWQQDPKHPYNREAWLQLALRNALKDELPEIKYAARFNQDYNGVLRYKDKVFSEKIAYTDGDFFRMFSFKLIAGNAEKLFDNKLDVVITPEIAEKYFGKEDPMGKIISIDNEGEKLFAVAGIIEAPPANSSFDFKILVPQENRHHYEKQMTQWGNFSTPCFVQLVEKTDTAKFRANLDKVVQKYMADKLEKWRKEAAIPVPKDVKMLEYLFTPLPEIHLTKSIGWHKVSDPQYSYILGGIAILILIIASINYVSLALTTSASRRTEVGIRKAAGAQRNQLVWQFSIESITLSLISMIIGIGLVFLFLSPFNQFTNKGIVISLENIFPVLAVSLALTLLIGLIAGSYPSLFLSSFRPALVLKGTFTSKVQASFTKPLVVLQFALSAFLIMSSLIMYQQMKFITTKDLGYDREQILVVPTQMNSNSQSDKVVERFRSRLQQETFVASVGGTGISFARGYSRYGYKIKGEQKSAYVYPIDAYYLSTLGATISLGRNFDPNIASDTTAVIVNEALVKDMKWTDPLNEYLNYQEDTVGLGAKVVGVVKDYHFLSLEKNIEPMFLSMNKTSIGNLNTMLIKFTPGDMPDKIEKLHAVWKELQPDKPFDYSFMDEDVAKQYKSYQQWMSIMGLSTGFAILISCLGLFGLSGINAVNRTKEMGIRKVMGADVKNIFILFNKQFIFLAMIAFIVAAPISYYVMNKWWLTDFQFKISVGWELFAVSIATGLLVALVTVSYHAIKTASVNPAETLKYE